MARSVLYSRSVGLITGEMMPVAVVAGQDDGALENHGAVSLGPNAGVAVAHYSITFYGTVMRMVISYEVATGEAVGTTLTQSVSRHGDIALAVPTQPAIGPIGAVLSWVAGLVPTVKAEQRSTLRPLFAMQPA